MTAPEHATIPTAGARDAQGHAWRRDVDRAVAAMIGLTLLLLSFAACGGESEIVIDGSSTVGPIAEAMAEEFIKVSGARIAVGISGTGGGFDKFCRGETDLSTASRPIKDTERAACEGRGIGFTEFRVALDGLTLVVHPDNEFIECITWSELRNIWDLGSPVTKWSDVNPSYPEEEIKLFGPGADSGTFDYFTATINGKTDQSRSDYTASEDDNVLVRGVQNEPYALAYFGFAYFRENSATLKALEIDRDIDSKGTPVSDAGRAGCGSPTEASIQDGSYSLARPLYIYVSDDAITDARVREFVRFVLSNPQLVRDVGYVPLPAAEYQKQLDALVQAAAVTGAVRHSESP